MVRKFKFIIVDQDGKLYAKNLSTKRAEPLCIKSVLIAPFQSYFVYIHTFNFTICVLHIQFMDVL